MWNKEKGLRTLESGLAPTREGSQTFVAGVKASAGNIARAEREKGTRWVNSTERPIYLDYNASTPILPEVLDAMLPYLAFLPAPRNGREWTRPDATR